MLDERILDRANRLIAAAYRERDKQLPLEISKIESEANKHGRPHSGTTFIHQVYEREVAARGIIIWENLVRIHRTLGSELTVALREDLKGVFTTKITEIAEQLFIDQEAILKKYKVSGKFPLIDARDQSIQKHEVEIDVYVDSLINMKDKDNPQLTSGSQYNFYGNVGAVQTGVNASANIVQNLGEDDKELLLKALEMVRESISTTHKLVENQKSELIDIIDESVNEINSEKPNNTKLRTFLTTLAVTIQSVASVPAAYQTMKSALLPLGIMLP